MAHAFDTGLAQPQRTIIQRQAIAALAGLKRPSGYLADVIAFGSVVRTYTDDRGVAQLVDALSLRAPSIAVATGDRTWSKTGTTGFQGKSPIDLLVYFCSSNDRNAQVGRLELDVAGAAANTSDPGLHVMMEHALELLIGAKFGSTTSIKQAEPQTEGELYTDHQVTIWLQVYRVLTMTTISEFRTATQLLTSIRYREAVNPAEVHLPAAATDTTTIDFNIDDLSS